MTEHQEDQADHPDLDPDPDLDFDPDFILYILKVMLRTKTNPS